MSAPQWWAFVCADCREVVRPVNDESDLDAITRHVHECVAPVWPADQPAARPAPRRAPRPAAQLVSLPSPRPAPVPFRQCGTCDDLGAIELPESGPCPDCRPIEAAAAVG